MFACSHQDHIYHKKSTLGMLEATCRAMLLMLVAVVN
jgi:hypothetical protein